MAAQKRMIFLSVNRYVSLESWSLKLFGSTDWTYDFGYPRAWELLQKIGDFTGRVITKKVDQAIDRRRLTPVFIFDLYRKYDGEKG